MRTKVTRIAAAVLVMGIVHTAMAGQLGYWAFDEGTGTTARDSSGKNNNGRLVAGPAWVVGEAGKALSFDGVDDYVEVPHNAALIPTTGKGTVSVWINAQRHTGPGGSQWQGILGKGGAPRLYNMYTESVSQSIHFSTGPSGAYIGTLGTTKVPLNEWVHCVVVVDGAHYYYFNGEPGGVAGQGATIPTGGTASLTIGQTGESNFFLGSIDEVRLYDVALTADEVKELFQGNPPSWPKAKVPSPADGAIGVITPLLQWTAGDGAILHNVYLGTSPDLTEADRVMTRWPQPFYYHQPGLESGVTYYWRVDEVAADGVTVATGDVWSFTAAPVKAYQPRPTDGAENVLLDTQLAWSPAADAFSHDVYLGTSRDDVEAGTGDTAKGNTFDLTFDPGPLAGDTTYFWRINEHTGDGSVIPGDIWSFTTLPEIPISDPNLVGWWKLDAESGTFAMDSSGYGNHGALLNGPQWTAGHDGGALQLDGVDDYAEVPHSDVLCVNSEVAVMAWVHPASLVTDYQGIVAKGNVYRSYSLYLQSVGTMHFSTGPNTGYTGSSSTGIVRAGEWSHVCAMVTEGMHHYFINGEPAGTGGSGAVLPGLSDVETVRIGNTQEGARYFNGRIDDVRVYNRALTEEELRDAMQGDPLRARDPEPADNATVDILAAEALVWTAGRTAIQHDVYLGQDKDAVLAADTSSAEYQGRQTDMTFILGDLVEFGGGDYFWRIDEVEADGVTVHKGLVWKFTILNGYVIDDMEGYNDVDNLIYDAWLDGYGTKINGSTVGYLESPFAEGKIVHSGKQSMPFDYNNLGPYFYSEGEHEFDSSQNWTLDGVDALSLWFKGAPARFVETEAGRYTISSTSNDVWFAEDNFRFVYKPLSGDGTIVAKIVGITGGSATWAKAGVMIRESLDPASTYAFMFPTPDGKRAFQSRTGTAINAVSVHSGVGAVTFPVWVKIERKGSQFTASYSQDGTTWTAQPTNETVDGGANPQVIGMSGTVYIGMAVASNNAAASPCFGDFSDVVVTGSTGGSWKIANVGPNPGNDPDKFYITLSDTSNKTATVVHPDPMAVNLTDWTEWQIPLSSFTGVNANRIKTLILGVGDRKATTPTGAGMLYIDDIRVIRQ